MAGFTIGINAIRTAAQLIDIAGDNIANANTPGYHAKRATVVSEVGPTTGHIRIGLGATVEDVRRLRNELVESTLLAHSQVRDRLAEELDHLTHIELLFTEPSGAGLDARLGEFFDSVDVLGGLARSFAEIARFFSVTQLNRLVLTCRCTGRHRGSADTSVIKQNIRLHGRVTS